MSDDKIAEIRARHSRDDRWRNLPSMICPQAHDDRALLLAEIERLNKDLATQQGCCDGAAAQDAHVRREREEHRAEVEGLRADNERLFNEDTKTRHALKGWALVCPDGGDEPTHERVAAVVAEVERLREEIKRLRADRRERIATAALNGLIANAVEAHTPAQFALAAVVVADALIAELDKEGGKP